LWPNRLPLMNSLELTLLSAYPLFALLFFSLHLAALISLGSAIARWRKAGLFAKGKAPSLLFSWADALGIGALLLLGILSTGGFFLSVVPIPFILGIARFRGVSVRSYFGLDRHRWREIFGLGLWICLAVYIPLQALASGCSAVAQAFGLPTEPQPAVQWFLRTRNTPAFWTILVAVLLIAPVGEEILFRGFLYPLLKRQLSSPQAIVWNAAVFSLFHAHWLTFLPLFLFGIVLAVAYEFSGALLLPMAIHFWFNGITMGLLCLFPPR
jgi:membrane protease YdiL (CAAX protease family)